MFPTFVRCSNGTSEDKYVTTYTCTQLANIYGFPAPTSTSDHVTVGVLSFGGGLVGTFDDNVLVSGDIVTYMQEFSSKPTVALVLVDGATNDIDSRFGIEGTGENTLDVECVVSACPSSKLTVIVYITLNDPQKFATLIRYAASTPVVVKGVSHLPTILSMSWGINETVPLNLAAPMNSALSFAAARGITTCISSGDDGSHGRTAPIVELPTSSPYCLSVGGTTLLCLNHQTYDSATVETTWSGGGGGTSKFYAKPTYQAALPGTMRSIPDMCLVADSHTAAEFYIYGERQFFGGTSVSAPLMAGFLAAINYNRFVTPILYGLGAGAPNFHDITAESNGAFTAVVGWDPCTGLGSVVGAVLGPALKLTVVTSLTVSPTIAQLVVGDSLTAVASVHPSDPEHLSLWFTNDPAIATVDADGVVTAQGPGECNITARTSGFIATLALSVVAVAPFTIPSTGQVYVGARLTIVPSAILSGGITWSTDRPDIATVDAAGVVTGIATGECRVTATTTSGFVTKLVLTVLVPPFTISPTTAHLDVGAHLTVVPSAIPSGGITWGTDKPDIATANAAGVVTGIATGRCTITASSTSPSFAAVLDLTVAIPFTIPTTAQLVVGAHLTIVPSASPSGGIAWTTNDPNIATVDAAGVATGRGGGECRVTATSTSGFFAELVLKVFAVAPFTIPTSAQLDLGTHRTIVPSAIPPGGITWTTDNPNIATVDAAGVVTSKASGVCLVTATATSSGFVAKLTLTVIVPFPTDQLPWSTSATGTATVISVTGGQHIELAGTGTLTLSMANTAGTPSGQISTLTFFAQASTPGLLRVAVVTTGAAYSYALFPVTSAKQEFSLCFTNFSSAATLEIILGGACSADGIDAQPNFTCVTSGWNIVAGADEGAAAAAAAFARAAVADGEAARPALRPSTNLAYVDGLLATPGVAGSSGPFAGGYWTGAVDTVAWTSVVEAPTAIVRDAWGQVEGQAQSFSMKTGNYFVCSSVNATVGRPCVASCFVRLGTATNFCLAVTDDQTWNSPSVARAFGAADGLNATGYTQVFLPFKISSSRLNVQCGWADGGTGPGAAMKTQTEGSVYAYGWQVRFQEPLATLGGLSVGNPAAAAPLNGLRVEGDVSFGGNLVVSGTATALAGGDISQKLRTFEAEALKDVGGADFVLADGLQVWVNSGDGVVMTTHDDYQQLAFGDSSSYMSLNSISVSDAFIGQPLTLRFAAWGGGSLRVCVVYDSVVRGSGRTVSGLFTATASKPQYFSLAFTPTIHNSSAYVVVGGPSGLFGSTAAAQPLGLVNASHWSIAAGTLTQLTGGLSVETLHCTGAAAVGATGTFGSDLAVLGSSTLTGQVTAKYAVSLQLAGAQLALVSDLSSLIDSSSTLGTHFLKFATVIDSHNWTPDYTHNVQLKIRETGLYIISLSVGGTATSSGEILINQGTTPSQGQFDGNLLTSQTWNSAYTGNDAACSCAAYLTPSQLINFVVVLASGTLAQIGGDRCRAHVVLIQQTT
jgi:uncharacterized protein YjdB